MQSSEKYLSQSTRKIIIFLCVALVSTFPVRSQEILGNLSDDDGDCNVDCDDLSFGVRSFQYSNGMSANFVRGQNDFVTNTGGTSTTKFTSPYDIALDPTTDKVFLSELGNSRVLRYRSYDEFLFGAEPEAVIGQINFTSNTLGVSTTNLYNPTGIFVDNTGTLWVCDWGNNRVLRFDNASSIATGSAANGVLGQSNFTSFSSGTSITTMNGPVDVVVEGGILWVADQTNGRILRFDNAALKSNGANADGVLGAANFTSTSSAVNQSNLAIAGGLAIICNSLYASDEGSNRILRWDNPEISANGANAVGVLGQNSYFTSTANTNQSGVSMPRILSTDRFNNLYVSDSDNNRVLIFNEVGSKANGSNADLVIGQNNFTSGFAGLDANSFDTPRGVAILDDGINQSLAIADVFNNRVMVFATTELVTDELAPISYMLPGFDPSGAGGINFVITSQPSIGSVVIDNASTGAFTYTPGGACAVSADTKVSIFYSMTNSNGCSLTGELKIRVTDMALCIEDCTNGIDDDLDCNIDCEDEECGVRSYSFTNGMDATSVFGQVDFTSNSTGISATALNNPTDFTIDPVTKKVFVADTYNHRILRYTSKNAMVLGELPEVVLGQNNFTTGVFGTAGDKLYYPTGIFIDESGSLWVSDYGNNRVLKYTDAGNLTTGANANVVLGQSNFTTRNIQTTAVGMNGPYSLTMDAIGTLWVADRINNRVIYFENADLKTNGSAADGVFGAPDFVTITTAVDASSTGGVTDVEIVCDRLYAVDQTNHRVMVWNSPKTLSNGAAADMVLGQSDFTSSSFGTTDASFKTPGYLGSDEHNNLYVSDVHNHRVLVFNEIGAKKTGASADLVIGQENFITESSGLSVDKFDIIYGADVFNDGNSTYLVVADGSNNRVLLFDQGFLSVDENSSLSSTLTFNDPSGAGGGNFNITSYPEFGTLALNNAATGDFTYTGPGVCPIDGEQPVTFTYQYTNANGCSDFGVMTIILNNVSDCIEDCHNGIDDDFNGMIDGDDPECDHDGDGIANKLDSDIDNDGILNVDENDVATVQCPNIVLRYLFQETFGSGSRTSSSEAQLCYEPGSGASCSSTYDAATYSSRLDPGEYAIVSSTDEANQGNYPWSSFEDFNGGANGRMMICNPSEVEQVVYSFRADGVILGVPIYFSAKFKNLYPIGHGELVSRVRIEFKDTTGTILYTRFQTLLENETWYNVFANHTFNTSSVVVDIINEYPVTSGNDFAMDDIVFRQFLRDCDGDGVANMFDLDTDNDGITDIAEQGNQDSNFNGMTDNVDGAGVLTLDLDGNGADDNYESEPILDTDGDSYTDIRDWDSDNDGLFDVLEAGGSDSNGDGRIGPTGVGYQNGNGLSDIVDPSDGGTGLIVVDSDLNGIMDAKEIDCDGDGCYDVAEAGFTDANGDGEIDGTGISIKGLVQGSDGYTGTVSHVTNYSLAPFACSIDSDGDLIVDGNDLDDDNDGIYDSIEYNCEINSDDIVRWLSNGTNQFGGEIRDAAIVASENDLVFGAGIGGFFGDSYILMSGMNQPNLQNALQDEDYIQYQFTTESNINAVYLDNLTYLKKPIELPDIHADSYGYDVALLISKDNFSSYTVLTEGYTIDDNMPAGIQTTDIEIEFDNFYYLEPSTTYSIRVVFYNRTTDQGTNALIDDVVINAYTCAITLDLDNDTNANHLDSDMDGDGCNDVIEAGFPDPDGDGYLGGAIPPTVDGDGKVTSGGM